VRRPGRWRRRREGDPVVRKRPPPARSPGLGRLKHRLVPRLARTFPGTAHVDAVGLRGEPDSAIWEYAARHEFVLVSKDDDGKVAVTTPSGV